MKYGDIYYWHERVWSEEEVKEMQPHPDEIFRHVYVKLINKHPHGEDSCSYHSKDGSWSCYAVWICDLDKEDVKKEYIETFKSHTGNETNVTFCTKSIREKFKRVYDF